MKQRVLNSNKPEYPKYGGRGIKICTRWLRSFENFLMDMGERPPFKTLDRVDNDGNYSPQNCQWATKKEQQRNRRNTRWVVAFGQTKALSEWAEKSGLHWTVINSRLTHGWTPEDAVSFPVGTKGYYRRRKELKLQI